MAATKPAPKPDPRQPARSLRWEGFLGSLRRRPFLAVGIGLLCVGLIALAVGFIVYPQSWAWYHWWQAQQASEKYDFAKARTHLEQCLKVWTKSGEVHFVLARAARRDGDVAAARAELALAKQYDWSEKAIELEHQLIQVQTGNIRPLENYLQDAVAKGHEDSLLILEALSAGYLQNSFLPEASLTTGIWLKLYPHMWQPHLVRALVYEKRHRADLAMQEYRRVLELNPDQDQARYQLAFLLITYAREYEEALKLLDLYVRRKPDDPAGLVAMARCQRALRQLEPARAAVERVLQQHPKHAEALYLRGMIAWEQDDLPRAHDCLSKAIKLAPDDLETNHGLAVVLRELGREAEAAPYEQRRQEIELDLRRLTKILQEIQDLELADAKSKGSRHGSGIALRREAASIYARMGDDASSVSWVLSALEQAPNDPETRRLAQELQERAKSRTSGAKPAMPARGLSEPSRPVAPGS